MSGPDALRLRSTCSSGELASVRTWVRSHRAAVLSNSPSNDQREFRRLNNGINNLNDLLKRATHLRDTHLPIGASPWRLLVCGRMAEHAPTDFKTTPHKPGGALMRRDVHR